MEFIINVIFILILIFIAIIDIKTLLIKNNSLIVLLILGLIHSWIIDMNIKDILFAMTVSFMIFGTIWLLNKNLIGAGDVKLITILAIWLDYPNILIAIYIAFLLGVITACIYLVFNLKQRKDKIAFAPFLVIGTIISYIMGNKIIDIWQMIILCGI